MRLQWLIIVAVFLLAVLLFFPVELPPQWNPSAMWPRQLNMIRAAAPTADRIRLVDVIQGRTLREITECEITDRQSVRRLWLALKRVNPLALRYSPWGYHLCVKISGGRAINIVGIDAAHDDTLTRAIKNEIRSERERYCREQRQAPNERTGGRECKPHQ